MEWHPGFTPRDLVKQLLLRWPLPEGMIGCPRRNAGFRVRRSLPPRLARPPQGHFGSGPTAQLRFHPGVRPRGLGDWFTLSLRASAGQQRSFTSEGASTLGARTRPFPNLVRALCPGYPASRHRGNDAGLKPPVSWINRPRHLSMRRPA